jgi:hypothetical protein
MNSNAYLPGYEHDIFVSYTHEKTLGEWTERLREELCKALNLIFSLKPPSRTFDVWIDEILRKNLPLNETLKKHVEGSALILIVMSPFFLESDWCRKEVAWFCATVRSRASSGRIFVVHARSTNRTTWPTSLTDSITDLPGYEFFALHPKVNLELPLGLIGDKDDEVAFKQALYNLAGQIKQQVDDLAQEAAARPSPGVASFAPAPRLRPPQPPATLVCFEVLGAAASAQTSAAEQEIRRIMAARNAEIFSPVTLGTPPRDPAGADRHLQRLLKAKSDCDGLVVLRVDRTAQLEDWLLDYLSEIRPMARRARMDGGVPRPLVVELSPDVTGTELVGVLRLHYEAPQFEERLAGWIDTLPTLRQAAA